jgi:ABC-type transporter Mla maintaining outer membrane lipid asymmetry permease subunit MlaE
MKRQQWGPYVVALAILVVGLAWVGVPASTLLVAGLVLACPLMMLVMMRGMHGGDVSGQDTSHNHDTPHEHHHHDATDRTNDAHQPLGPTASG